MGVQTYNCALVKKGQLVCYPLSEGRVLARWRRSDSADRPEEFIHFSPSSTCFAEHQSFVSIDPYRPNESLAKVLQIVHEEHHRITGRKYPR